MKRFLRRDIDQSLYGRCYWQAICWWSLASALETIVHQLLPRSRPLAKGGQSWDINSWAGPVLPSRLWRVGAKDPHKGKAIGASEYTRPLDWRRNIFNILGNSCVPWCRRKKGTRERLGRETTSSRQWTCEPPNFLLCPTHKHALKRISFQVERENKFYQLILPSNMSTSTGEM